MMRTAAVSKLKARLSEHLAWGRRGEEVLVTDHGRPVARIVPVGPAGASGTPECPGCVAGVRRA